MAQCENKGFKFIGGHVTIVSAAAGDHSKAIANNVHIVSKGATCFEQEANKAEFLKYLEELRSTLRDLKARVEGAAYLPETERDRLADEILGQIVQLNQAKEVASTVPVGEEAAAQESSVVEGSLKKATGLLESLQSFTSKAADLGETTIRLGKEITPFIVKALPLIASARHLFGLP